jgi:hypothetical protein
MPASDPNRGVLDVLLPNSPLAHSWLTSSLYILSDPILYPSEETEVIATISNADTYDPPPAIMRAGVEAGQVIVQVGHPTDKLRREQMPLFMNAVLLALGSKGELTGQAIQTFNADFASDVFPAYEAGIPVSATLTFANLWDTPLLDVVLTATVSNGFDVLSDSVSPAPAEILKVFEPTTQTLIVWELGNVEHGEVRLSYVAETQEDVLAPGSVVFDHSQAVYQEPSGKTVSMGHSDRLNSLMAARLVGDRDVEPDRAYHIPEGGVYLDVALALENKESTLGSNLLLSDVLYMLYPIVDLENQDQILATEDGETVWMRNEAFFWDDPRYPLPQGVASADTVLTLDDWQGDWCVFTSTVPSGTLRLPVDLGDSVTIPITYSDYLSITAEGELLLPCLPLYWDLGDFPGYWYEEPAARYGVRSRELFSRSVTFSGDVISSSLVVSASGGSVYVTAGGYPVLYSEFLAEARPYAAQAPVQARLTWTDVWSRTGELPLRASFYDVFPLAACATCGPHFERHAAVNLTFGLLADLDGDGVPETPVRELPTRLAETDLNLMLKSYSLGPGTAMIPADENIIDLPIFNGLGIKILPREDGWEDSWYSPLGGSQLVSVTYTPGYDHLYFQQEIPDGVAEVVHISSTIQTYSDLNREGMFKLHDGARFHYRQIEAGPNRYETYDSHVHTVVGLSSDAQVSKDVGPRRVSIYGDTIYYLFSLDDPYDPRTFNEDPYMQSWGYGDMVATTYVGGRQETELFHSILSVGDRTWLRVQIDNNHGEALTGVQVVPQAPPGISVTPLFTDPDTAPEPIWPELAFLNLEEIPDAWRGVYYFELQVDDYPGTANLGGVWSIPIDFIADNPPAGFEIPPATIAIRDGGGAVPQHIYGPASNLALTDTLPSFSQLQRAVRLDQAQVVELWDAIDADEAVSTFAAFDDEVFFDVSEAGIVNFNLPVQTLPTDAPLYIAASAAISAVNHGANTVNDGAVLGYDDVFGLRWVEQSYPETVEALGAAVQVDYFCDGGAEGWYGEGVVSDGGGSCWVPPGQASQIVLWATAYNYGDDIAESVAVSLELPSDVIPIWADPPWQEWDTENNRLTWSWGDLAPGSFQEMEIILQVEPDYPIEDRRAASGCVGDICASEAPLVVVEESRGRFVDAFSERLIQGRLGSAFNVWVQDELPTLYLPILLSNYAQPQPDLVPLDLSVTPSEPIAGQAAEITLVLQNQGTATAVGGDEGKLWIDFYVDPISPPEANQLWESLCSGPLIDCQGGAWSIGSVAPGEVITLTSSEFDPEFSRWEDSFAQAGEHTLYVYVDTWEDPEPVGTVSESNEDNNRFGPLLVTVWESNQTRVNLRDWFQLLLSQTSQ